MNIAMQELSDVEAVVARTDASARPLQTPCGDGAMTWRIWGEGPPLVLLHGGHGSWSHWIRNISALAMHHTLYVPDLPGYGKSTAPSEPHSAESIGEIVAQGLAILLPPPARYDIAGFSFGGIIGGAVSALQGRQVRRLVIIGSSGLGLPRVGITGLRKWSVDMTPAALHAIHRNNLAAIMIADPRRIDDLAIHLQTQNALKARLRGSAIARSDALRRALPRVSAGFICLSGTRDVYVVPNLKERQALFRAVQPETPFRFVEDAGHWVMYEQPEAFNEALIELLAGGAIADPADPAVPSA